jgi:AcrR family transcriptional regulator
MSNLKPVDSDQRAAHKGQQTKAAIVEAALGLATQIGLEGLSIGALAEVARMSKSGVFAHFGSREELQLSVVRAYHERFEAEVFYPGLSAPRPRLIQVASISAAQLSLMTVQAPSEMLWQVLSTHGWLRCCALFYKPKKRGT